MSGTRIGALKTKRKNLERDPDFYKKMGALGGSAPTKKLKGFAANRELASRVGRIGGLKSRRKRNA